MRRGAGGRPKVCDGVGCVAVVLFPRAIGEEGSDVPVSLFVLCISGRYNTESTIYTLLRGPVHGTRNIYIASIFCLVHMANLHLHRTVGSACQKNRTYL